MTEELINKGHDISTHFNYCPYCACRDFFAYEGVNVLNVENEELVFFKFWCDQCERRTYVEAEGCKVP